jgi:hypothetical protein
MPPTDPDQNAPRKTDHPADDSGWQIRAEMALATTAANNRLITYAELAEAAGLTGRHRINRLTVWLEELIDSDAAGQCSAARRARDFACPRRFARAGLFHEMRCARAFMTGQPTDRRPIAFI